MGLVLALTMMRCFGCFAGFNSAHFRNKNKWKKKNLKPEQHICMYHLGPMSYVCSWCGCYLDSVSNVGCYINVVMIGLIVNNHLIERKKINKRNMVHKTQHISCLGPFVIDGCVGDGSGPNDIPPSCVYVVSAALMWWWWLGPWGCWMVHSCSLFNC